jgi:hypothetical protein
MLICIVYWVCCYPCLAIFVLKSWFAIYSVRLRIGDCPPRVLEDQALERALCVSVLAWLCGADLEDFSGLRFEDGCNRPCGERLLAWGR